MKNTIRLGVVGLGNVAQNNYLPYLSRQENVELFCCSRDPEKAKACAARFGIHACTTLEELAGMHLDAVFILTLEQFHYGTACRLLEFSRSGSSSRNRWWRATDRRRSANRISSMRSICWTRAKRAGTEIAMNFNYRFFDQMIRLRRLVEERDLGPLRQSSWLVHYACWSHCLDLLRWFGGEIAEVSP
ncbi:MAG: Gfo/Idh/MocA family oxidoreductase [Lentisphaeria bacterium]|nr:MAG: Gfo/Idh/MocA family oxidoreductase [Lentisphaeria bacterium]